MTWRNTSFDAARVALILDPPWLLAPLLLRDRCATPELGRDWQRWWAAAVAFRPGGPAPRQQDLIAFSPALTRLWQDAEPGPLRPAGTRRGALSPVEAQRLDTFGVRTGRAPAPRTLTVLVVPFGADLLERPERDRLVVDAALRSSGERYLALLDPVLADFF